MIRTVKMWCPKGCKFIGKTDEEWKAHFKKEHPEVKEIQIGKQIINLEGD